MGSLEKVLGLEQQDPAAADLERVLRDLCIDSARRGRLDPADVDGEVQRLTRIANLPAVAVAATTIEAEPSPQPIPDSVHRVTTLVLDDSLVA